MEKDIKKKIIKNMTFDEERALYNLTDGRLEGCTFAGPADGESALKEARRIELSDCSFSLRYPLWHTEDFSLENCKMDELTRAAIWYSHRGVIKNSTLGGIKALRECSDIELDDVTAVSPEIAWRCSGLRLNGCDVTGEYAFFECKALSLSDTKLHGKYSFQYTEGLRIDKCELRTKDAFWHAKNVTVTDSIVDGEYLGWYSDGLTLINCRISGTQPLCYCKNLTLINCTMEGTDLSFEYSEVNATVCGHILSVKNPHSGKIVADSIGEIILEGAVMDTSCEIVTKEH